MKFDKKGEKIDSYNSGLMKKGGVGPEGTAMSHMWGGESVEKGEQMGGNRDFLKGPGSKHIESEGTFNVKHSGIVKQGMDSGIYRMQESGMHKMGGDDGAPFHVIEARNTGVDTLLEGQKEGEDYKSKAIDKGAEGLEETIESSLDGGGSPEGDTEIYSGEDLEKIGSKDYSDFGQDTVDEAMDVDTDLVSMGKKKKKGIDFSSFLDQ